MTGDLPTRKGDVLILCTANSLSVYVVGRVSMDGQQSFRHEHEVQYLPDRGSAVDAAKALQMTGRRTFLLNMDTRGWREIAQ